MRPSRKKVAEVISEKLDHGQSLKSLSKEVAAYLLTEERSKELNSIMRDVISLRAEKGLVESSVTTAHELGSQAEKSVRDLIKTIRPKAHHITIDHRLDPNLVGGFKLDVVSQQLDLSVRAKLNRLKRLTINGGIK